MAWAAGLRAVSRTLPLPPPMPLRTRFGVMADGRVVAIVAFLLLESAGAILVYTDVARVLGDTVHAHRTLFVAISVLEVTLAGLAVTSWLPLAFLVPGPPTARGCGPCH